GWILRRRTIVLLRRWFLPSCQTDKGEQHDGTEQRAPRAHGTERIIVQACNHGCRQTLTLPLLAPEVAKMRWSEDLIDDNEAQHDRRCADRRHQSEPLFDHLAGRRSV